jgi:hypothetical protein
MVEVLEYVNVVDARMHLDKMLVAYRVVDAQKRNVGYLHANWLQCLIICIHTY